MAIQPVISAYLKSQRNQISFQSISTDKHVENPIFINKREAIIRNSNIQHENLINKEITKELSTKKVHKAIKKLEKREKVLIKQLEKEFSKDSFAQDKEQKTGFFKKLFSKK